MNQTAGERRKNVKKIASSLVALFLLAAPLPAAPRHRPARPPASDAVPAGWLANHAYRSVDAIATLAGPATMIGLGDDTHGTHEYFDAKLHMIKKLVHDEGFTLIAFEGPYPDFNRIDDYVLGGSGDPRVILRRPELGYWFWASDEIVAVIEWVREYNRTRGSDKPPVEIAGMDVTDTEGAADMVTSYLDAVDPPAAVTARMSYSDCLGLQRPSDCAMRLAAVRDDLNAREAELARRSSQRSFEIAFHAASIVAVGFNATGLGGYFEWRDQNMAINALRLQERRTPNGRVILWGHQEHLGRTRNIQGSTPVGKWLDDQLGAKYFVVGSSSGEGSFNVVRTPPEIGTRVVVFPSITTLDYESYFQSAAIPLMLIPLHGALPEWLTSSHQLRGGTGGSPYDKLENLAQKFDAILYIDRTTPSSNFW